MTKRSPTARWYLDRIPRVPIGRSALALLGKCSDWLAALDQSGAEVEHLLGYLG